MLSRPTIRRVVLAAVAVGSVTTALLLPQRTPAPHAARSAAAPPPAAAKAPTAAVGDAGASLPPAITEWSGPPRPALRETARRWLASDSPALPSLDLDLEPGRAVRVAVSSFRAEGEDSGTFTGQVPELPGSTVVVSYVGRAEAGLVHLPAEGIAYEYRVGDDGVRRLRRLDLRQAPECALCTHPAG